jgi:hypothetical protein
MMIRAAIVSPKGRLRFFDVVARVEYVIFWRLDEFLKAYSLCERLLTRQVAHS